MLFWYDKEPDDQDDVKIIALKCSNCGKTGLSINNMNTKYKDIITSFALNILLDHVGMSLLIERHEQLKYDMGKDNPN